MTNFVVLRSPLALIKILLTAVLVTIVLLARYGNDGLRLQFGVDNTDFLGVGTSLGLALIVPLILLAYILGGSAQHCGRSVAHWSRHHYIRFIRPSRHGISCWESFSWTFDLSGWTFHHYPIFCFIGIARA